MKKKLIKTTFFLLFYSSIAKVLSFVVRIVLARKLSTQAMNYYSLTMPTMLLLLTLAQMGIPNAMAKLLASSKEYRKTLKASILFSIANNLLLLLVVALAIPLLANLIFHEAVLIPVLYSCLWMIPLVTLSGLCKGYLMGKQQLIPYSMAQITEEVFRLVFLIITLPLCVDAVILAKLAILSMAVGELGSSLHMLLAILFKARPSLDFLKERPNRLVYQSLLMVALPMTFSRLIGSFSYFLEPMCMLMNVPVSAQAAMINQFTLLNSYVQPILTLPSFATIMISNWALPSFSEAFSKKDRPRMKSIFNYTCGFSLLISALWSILLYFFPEFLCQLLYKQTVMAPMLKSLALPFSIYGLQPVLSVLIHGSNQSPKALLDTTVGCAVRLLLMVFLPLWVSVDSLAIALAVSMLMTTLMHAWHVVRVLFFNHI